MTNEVLEATRPKQQKQAIDVLGSQRFQSTQGYFQSFQSKKLRGWDLCPRNFLLWNAVTVGGLAHGEHDVQHRGQHAGACEDPTGPGGRQGQLPVQNESSGSCVVRGFGSLPVTTFWFVLRICQETAARRSGRT